MFIIYQIIIITKVFKKIASTKYWMLINTFVQKDLLFLTVVVVER